MSKRVWLVFAGVATVGAALVVLGVVLAVPGRKSSQAPTTSPGLPSQFSAYGVQFEKQFADPVTLDWHYDATAMREAVVYNLPASSLRFIKDYTSATTELSSSPAVCTAIPMPSTRLTDWRATSVVAIGTETDLDGNTCQLYKGVRADGTSFYFSLGTDGHLCTLEIDFNVYRFHAANTFRPLDPTALAFVCPAKHPQCPADEPNCHVSRFWKWLECEACEQAMDAVLDEGVEVLGDAVCAPLAVFAEVCGELVELVVEGVCDRYDCTKRACQKVHMC